MGVYVRDCSKDYNREKIKKGFWIAFGVVFLIAWWLFGYNVGSVQYSLKSCEAYQQFMDERPIYDGKDF